MRRVSRRSEIPMAPVQIPQDSRCPRTCADSTDVHPVHLSHNTCADSRCPRTRCPLPDTTCAYSRCPRATCADSTHLCRFSEPVNISTCIRTCADSRCPEPYSRCHKSRTCTDSSVTSPTATYADSSRTYEHSSVHKSHSQPVQIPVSQVPQPPMQILHVSEPVQIPVSQVPQSPVQILHVSEPVQIPVSQVPQSPVQSLPEPLQLLAELDMLDPLESTDAFDQLMSFVFDPKNSRCFTRYPLFLMRISSPSWMNLKGSLWT
ncbi:hypothetical protein TNCV_2495861 [Trichonephila clavipes]|nr:hypothetical protein TNCV_2495861 [Trichonephila clavipes]